MNALQFHLTSAEVPGAIVLSVVSARCLGELIPLIKAADFTWFGQSTFPAWGAFVVTAVCLVS